MTALLTAIKGLKFQLQQRHKLDNVEALEDEDVRENLQKNVAMLEAHIKEINEELKPVKEAIKVATGYTTEAHVMLDNQQLSIFDI